MEVESHFPGWNRSSRGLSLLKKFWLARIDHAIDPSEDTEAAINSVLKGLASENRPKKYSPGSGNVLSEHLAEFEKQAGMIEKHFGRKVSELNLFEHISRLEQIKDDLKTQTKQDGLTGIKP